MTSACQRGRCSTAAKQPLLRFSTNNPTLTTAGCNQHVATRHPTTLHTTVPLSSATAPEKLPFFLREKAVCTSRAVAALLLSASVVDRLPPLTFYCLSFRTSILLLLFHIMICSVTLPIGARCRTWCTWNDVPWLCSAGELLALRQHHIFLINLNVESRAATISWFLNNFHHFLTLS